MLKELNLDPLLPRPDHKSIFLDLEFHDSLQRGPGNWKFNNQLLQDEKYIELIESCFPKILEKYEDVHSHQLLWELIKWKYVMKLFATLKGKGNS